MTVTAHHDQLGAQIGAGRQQHFIRADPDVTEVMNRHRQLVTRQVSRQHLGVSAVRTDRDHADLLGLAQ